MSAFRGFPPETFAFFQGLAFNNERAWFEAHRADYDRFVVEPALAFIETLAPAITAISPRYRALAKKQGGSLMRIHRDVRFSRDKTPYKLNIGIQFRHEAAADVHAPGFYLNVAPGDCFLGAGCWRPAPPELAAMRAAIAADPAGYRQARDAGAAAGWRAWGESLKTMPRGWPADHPAAAEIKLIDHVLDAPLADADCQSADLAERAAAAFRDSAPYMAWLCRCLGAEF